MGWRASCNQKYAWCRKRVTQGTLASKVDSGLLAGGPGSLPQRHPLRGSHAWRGTARNPHAAIPPTCLMRTSTSLTLSCGVPSVPATGHAAHGRQNLWIVQPFGVFDPQDAAETKPSPRSGSGGWFSWV